MAKIDYQYEQPVAVLERKGARQRLAIQSATYGGYNPQTGVLTPLRLVGIKFDGTNATPSISISDVFDAVTAAVEAQALDSETWPTQLFDCEASMNVMLRAMERFEDGDKFIDPWYQAFSFLASGGVPGNKTHCATAEQLADTLRVYVYDVLEPVWQ